MTCCVVFFIFTVSSRIWDIFKSIHMSFLSLIRQNKVRNGMRDWNSLSRTKWESSKTNFSLLSSSYSNHCLFRDPSSLTLLSTTNDAWCVFSVDYDWPPRHSLLIMQVGDPVEVIDDEEAQWEHDSGHDVNLWNRVQTNRYRVKWSQWCFSLRCRRMMRCFPARDSAFSAVGFRFPVIVGKIRPCLCFFETSESR